MVPNWEATQILLPPCCTINTVRKKFDIFFGLRYTIQGKRQVADYKAELPTKSQL